MEAIQFGAGNIGRGFIAALLHKSGYKVLFADVIDDIINEINGKHEYTVHIIDDQSEDILIDSVSALNSNSNEIINKIASADLITTAVGVNVLPKIAPIIAKGLASRRDTNNTLPLNIIACENTVMATNKLKNSVFAELSEKDLAFVEHYVGFANCSVDRIVPPAVDFANSLDVAVERYYEWNICSKELRGDVNIKGANYVDNLEPYIERKLFTLNTGHAICAYLGFAYDKTTTLDSINDDYIFDKVKNAMCESGRGLVRKYSFNEAEHNKYIDKIIQRFKNPYLHDEVTRVGRQPLRKLSIDDRLVKPTLTALEYDLPIDNLLLGIAAALHFNNPKDSESVEMQEKISNYGLHDAILDITNIANEELLNKIEENYYQLLNKER